LLNDADPLLNRPPPMAAVFPEIVEWFINSVPWLRIPPPLLAEPPVIVRFEMVAVTLASTKKSSCAPPPLTVMGPALLPLMVIEWEVLLKVNVPASVMVVALVKSDGVNVMSALLVSESACATAQGRLPVVAALLLVFVTHQVLGTTRTSSNSI
jgi:hypothetical protein